jgi:hypothetical protein
MTRGFVTERGACTRVQQRSVLDRRERDRSAERDVYPREEHLPAPRFDQPVQLPGTEAGRIALDEINGAFGGLAKAWLAAWDGHDPSVDARDRSRNALARPVDDQDRFVNC